MVKPFLPNHRIPVKKKRKNPTNTDKKTTVHNKPRRLANLPEKSFICFENNMLS